MSTAQATPPTTASSLQQAIDDNLDLFQGFIRAIIEDPSLAEQVPDGVSTILLPRDDPDRLEAALALAAHFARQGTSLYLRHVEPDGRPVPLPPAPPEPPEPPDEA